MKSKLPTGVLRPVAVKKDEPVFKVPPPKEKHVPPKAEEMEIAQVTQQLSEQLYIEDIDSGDADNPQLCSEYVKDIYIYMRELEVCPYTHSPHAYHHLPFTDCLSTEEVPRASHVHAVPATDQRTNESHSRRLAGTGSPQVLPPSGDSLLDHLHCGSLPCCECRCLYMI